MTTVAFTDNGFLNEVMPDVPGCPVAIVTNALRNASIEFCTRSNAWRSTLAAIAVVGSTNHYTIPMPDVHTDAGEIYTALLDGVPIYPKTPSQLDEWYPQWRTASDCDVDYYARENTDEILLAAMPAAAALLVLTCSLIPSQDASGLDSVLYKRYRDAIAHGAKAKLMLIPKKPWSDPQSASYHLDEFNKAISIANVAASRGNTRAPIRTKSYSS